MKVQGAMFDKSRQQDTSMHVAKRAEQNGKKSRAIRAAGLKEQISKKSERKRIADNGNKERG